MTLVTIDGRSFQYGENRWPLAYPLVSVASEGTGLIGYYGCAAVRSDAVEPHSVYRIVSHDEDRVTVVAHAGNDHTTRPQVLNFASFTGANWCHIYSTDIPTTTTEEQTTMTDIDPTAVHPRDLTEGTTFVWQNSAAVRSWLAVTEEHVLRLYRVRSVTTDIIRYEDIENSERFTMSLPTVGGTHDADVLVYRFRSDDAPAPAPTTTLLPRTAAEAQRLHAILTSVDARADVVAATATLARALPGGELEAKGLEVAQRKSLCDVYERVVTGAFGWAPRPHNAATDYRRTFERDVVRVERDYADNAGYALTRFAERYARGGVVNEAIVDAMESNLEAHKVPDVNEVLDACGFDGMTRSEVEYRVTTTATRMVRVTGWVRQTQPVSLYVTAASADEALEQAQELDPHDHVSRWDWDTDSYDIDWDVDDSETDDEDTDWDYAEVEEA